MRLSVQDWNHIATLMHIGEKSAGFPSMSNIHKAVMKELQDIHNELGKATEPMDRDDQKPQGAEPVVEAKTNTEGGESSDTGRRI